MRYLSSRIHLAEVMLSFKPESQAVKFHGLVRMFESNLLRIIKKQRAAKVQVEGTPHKPYSSLTGGAPIAPDHDAAPPDVFAIP